MPPRMRTGSMIAQKPSLNRRATSAIENLPRSAPPPFMSMYTAYSDSSTPIIAPGTMPAMNSSPTSSGVRPPATMANTSIGIDGGIRMPREPAVLTRPIENRSE